MARKTRAQSLIDAYSKRREQILQSYLKAKYGTEEGRLGKKAKSEYDKESSIRKLTTNRRASNLLGRAEKLAAQAERRISGKYPTKEAKETAEREFRKSLDLFRAGIEERKDEALGRINVAIYNQIKDAIESCRNEKTIKAMGFQAIFDEYDTGNKDTQIRIASEFERAYFEDPRVFDDYIYGSDGPEGTFQEAKSTLKEIVRNILG